MGGSKTAILAQVVHFYSDGVGHITVGGNNYHERGLFRLISDRRPRLKSIQELRPRMDAGSYE
jgi:hypothetical protein